MTGACVKLLIVTLILTNLDVSESNFCLLLWCEASASGTESPTGSIVEGAIESLIRLHSHDLVLVFYHGAYLIWAQILTQILGGELLCIFQEIGLYYLHRFDLLLVAFFQLFLLCLPCLKLITFFLKLCF